MEHGILPKLVMIALIEDRIGNPSNRDAGRVIQNIVGDIKRLLHPLLCRMVDVKAAAALEALGFSKLCLKHTIIHLHTNSTGM